ncbi:hypothetical protein I79_016024 [Cricetulus griseus]|uniref:Uncharacterized protein n=1 Tax=Cricetulus griseus TaxID=10029 RepID=G3HYA1_CRIGR|nr:hypothetical protein I79_016024 [Cricetulus griseus]
MGAPAAKCVKTSGTQHCAQPMSTALLSANCVAYVYCSNIFVSYTGEKQASFYKADNKYLRLASPKGLTIYSSMPLQGAIKQQV